MPILPNYGVEGFNLGVATSLRFHEMFNQLKMNAQNQLAQAQQNRLRFELDRIRSFADPYIRDINLYKLGRRRLGHRTLNQTRGIFTSSAGGYVDENDILRTSGTTYDLVPNSNYTTFFKPEETPYEQTEVAPKQSRYEQDTSNATQQNTDNSNQEQDNSFLELDSQAPMWWFNEPDSPAIETISNPFA